MVQPRRSRWGGYPIRGSRAPVQGEHGVEREDNEQGASAISSSHTASLHSLSVRC